MWAKLAMLLSGCGSVFQIRTLVFPEPGNTGAHTSQVLCQLLELSLVDLRVGSPKHSTGLTWELIRNAYSWAALTSPLPLGQKFGF